MTNCLLIDDEPLANELLAGYIRLHDRLRLLRVCERPADALEHLVAGEVDLLFLDIRMPKTNGIDFLQSLKTPPAVIFTTAYSEFAAKSYELDAVDYLMKPVTYQRFLSAVDKYFRIAAHAGPDPTFTYFKVDGSLLRLNHSEIICIEAVKDYVLIRTTGKTHISHLTMKSLETLLPARDFRRIHRSYFVNRSFINRIGTVEVEVTGYKIPFGATYKPGFAYWFAAK